ncbi:hypothetical protein UACE39S_00988 [Ureibacillus acetophenoni]
MTTYTENLYEYIFKKYAKEYNQLRVISGYGSASFLKRVIEDFPHLNIKLFLGMTSEGVSIINHTNYQKYTQSNEKVNIYYQVSKIPNHMKILEFSNSTSKITFVGSANFTENGFLIQRELMTKINDDLDMLFNEQCCNSLICIDPMIEIYINIYIEDSVKIELPEKVKESNEILEYGNDHKFKNKMKQEQLFKNKLNELNNRIDIAYYNTFEISVVLKSENNPMWHCKGINAWTEGKEPVLEQTPRLSFINVFPANKEFTIYTDDNQTFIAKLTGNFNGKLSIINSNLYDYMYNRISLTQKRPISYDDLVVNGLATMYFKRINEVEYIMSFNKNY